MKHLFKIIAATTCLLGFSMNSQAQTVAIKFAKGSYCGSYSGNFAGKRFVLGLGKGQTLEISAPNTQHATVRNSKGHKLPLNAQDYFWKIPAKGTYSITFTPFSHSSTYDSIQFCAY